MERARHMHRNRAFAAVSAGIFCSVLPGLARAQTPPAAATPAAAAPAAAAPAAPATVTLNGPAMTAPLAMPGTPNSIDVGTFGKWYVDGVLSGLAYEQSNRTAIDTSGRIDLSNGQIIVQKIDGLVQFYVQAGGYTLPSLGTAYIPVDKIVGDTFGAVPVAYAKLAPSFHILNSSDSFSLMAGKLPTLIGAEYTFTFENFNIERGLLWNQEPAIVRGAQANYTVGPLAFSLQLSDGFYSNRYNWLTGSVAWTINPHNTVSLVAGGNLGRTGTATFATPTVQNNGQVYNLIYTYSNAPWTITPYFQATHNPARPEFGYTKDVTSYSGAVLVNYAFNDHWSLAGRAEYIGTTGSRNDPAAPNILYGPGSDAWSVTLTPTFQYKQLFVRAEFSFTQAEDASAGFAFGLDGNARNQARGLLEAGFIL
jgi:hypothetical protein